MGVIFAQHTEALYEMYGVYWQTFGKLPFKIVGETSLFLPPSHTTFCALSY